MMMPRLSSCCALTALTALLGCEGALEGIDDTLSTSPQELIGWNGLDQNGLNGNGLNGNGLNSNGLNSNGLNGNGLNSNGFKTWFNARDTDQDGVVTAADRDLHGMTLKYLVACACPAGTSRTFTDSTQKAWSWAGSLGLAPGWCSGSPVTTAEKQKITACLAAHVNTRGFRIMLSLTGLGITRSALEQELWSFSETTWFGNLWEVSSTFPDKGRTFACKNFNQLSSMQAMDSIGRACGKGCLSTLQAGNCKPMVPLEGCDERCSFTTAGVATTCTAEGQSYTQTLSTFLPQPLLLGDTYSSSDGVYRRCDFQDWRDGCVDRPLRATKSANARWDVYNDKAVESFPGEIDVGSRGRYAAQLATTATSWIKVPTHLKTTGTRTLHIVYTSSAACSLRVSVDDGVSYKTLSFPRAASAPGFDVLSTPFNFTSTSPTIVLTSLGNGTCSPLVDWIYITQ